MGGAALCAGFKFEVSSFGALKKTKMESQNDAVLEDLEALQGM